MTTITTDMQTAGFDELDEILAQFTARIAKKAIDGAISYGATPMLKDTKNRAAKAENDHLMKYGDKYELVRPGLLKESIKRRRLKLKELQELNVSAGYALYIGKGKTQKLYPRYWHFIEYGTSKLAPNPYWRPAFEANKEQFVKRFGEKLAQNIDKYRPTPPESDD